MSVDERFSQARRELLKIERPEKLAAEDGVKSVLQVNVSPSFTPDYVITAKLHEHSVSFSLSMSNSNIWNSMIAHHGKYFVFAAQKPTTIMRDYEATTTSDVIREAVCAVERGITEYREPHLMGLDGVSYSFEFVDNKTHRSGVLDVWSPPAFSLGERMVKLVDLLALNAYVDATGYDSASFWDNASANLPKEIDFLMDAQFRWKADELGLADHSAPEKASVVIERWISSALDEVQAHLNAKLELPAVIENPSRARRFTENEFSELNRTQVANRAAVGWGHLHFTKDDLEYHPELKGYERTAIWYVPGKGYVLEVRFENGDAERIASPCTYPAALGMSYIDASIASDRLDCILHERLGRTPFFEKLWEDKPDMPVLEYLKNVGIELPSAIGKDAK